MATAPEFDEDLEFEDQDARPITSIRGVSITGTGATTRVGIGDMDLRPHDALALAVDIIEKLDAHERRHG